MSSNIFGNSDKNSDEFKEKVDTHSKGILALTQRQKDLESALDLASEKIELLDHNSILNFKKLRNDVKALSSDILSIKQEIESIKEFNSKVTKQLRLMTTKDEVTKLEKYIDLWNPIEFVTREEYTKGKEEFVSILTKIVEEFLSGKYDDKFLKKKAETLKKETSKKTSDSKTEVSKK